MKLYLDTLRANGYHLRLENEVLIITRETGEPIKPEVQRFIDQYSMSEAQATVIVNNMTADIDMAITINDISMAVLPMANDDQSEATA